MPESETPPSPPLAGPAHAPRQERHAFFGLATLALIVGILARTQAIVVPLALAIVVAFALSPAVKRLERLLGRGLAVALVVFVSLAAVSGFGYLLQRQLVELSAEMTKYSDSIRKKVVALRGSDAGGLSSLSKSIDRVVHEMDERVVADESARAVRVIPNEATASERIEHTLAPVVEPLARSVIVLVLVIFLLIKREDLRDRFIRLTGRRNVTLTTRTLDEAGQRISRFLTHQSAINGAFGVIVAVGLAMIGIPYAPLWGFVAAVLRFVPFVGTMLAMVLPGALAFAKFSGWWQLGATLGLFLGLDMLAAYLVEPIVIGAKTGVSSMAMLVSAIFWSWLWGPVGLVLSTPLTVCLTVMGKHVPRMSYLAVLLGDEPALEDNLVLYQRLLSEDEDEAQEILEKRFRTTPPGQVFDDVIVPTLLLAGRDKARGEITETDHNYVLRTLHALVTASAGQANAPSPDTSAEEPADLGAPRPPLRVLGVSARTAADEMIWEMWARLFDPKQVEVESVGSAYLSSPEPGPSERQPPDVVCVVSMPPGGLTQARYICRRLRAKLPDTTIIVIRPGVHANGNEAAKKLAEDGATAVCFTLEEARAAVQRRA